MKKKPFETIRLTVNFPFFREYGLPEDMKILYSSSVGNEKAEVTGIYEGKTVYNAIIKKEIKTGNRKQELFLQDRILLACVKQMKSYIEKDIKTHEDSVDESTKEFRIS